ncbi:BRCT domain-containing protein [Neoconidiobolus thromboides FSU 785]|nr:BRCT domain-containing protein [Neoconidiobolus thromboides FSU 785]
MEAKEKKNKPIFPNVRYWINPYLPLELRKQLRNLLEQNGAYPAIRKEEDLELNQTKFQLFDIKRVTHIISATWDFIGHSELIKSKRNCRIVTPKWVFDCTKCNIHYSSKFYSPEPKSIFSGIIICCHGLPTSDMEKIYGGVVALGGQYRINLSKEVTHYIVLDSEAENNVSKLQKENDIKLVTSHWFEDCIKLRKLLPEKNYQFPTPNIFKDDFNPLKSIVKVSRQYLGVEEEVNSTKIKSSWFNSNYLSGLVIYLDNELQLQHKFVEKIKDELTKYGARISAIFDLSIINCYICQFKNSKRYEESLKASIIIGNLTWLFHIILSKRLDSPLNQLLFYPTQAYAVPDMKDYVISISNYDQGSKEYLEKLITAMGATFTTGLSAKNTHLICASQQGEKYSKAPDWNIIVVNHLWLEDCYRSWSCQPVTKIHYSHFPHGVSMINLVSYSNYSYEDIAMRDDLDVNENSISITESEPEEFANLQNGIEEEESMLPTLDELFGEVSKGTIQSIQDVQEEAKIDISKEETEDNQNKEEKKRNGAQEEIKNQENKERTNIKEVKEVKEVKEECNPRPSRKAATFATKTLMKLMEAQNQFEKRVGNKLKKFSLVPPPIVGEIKENVILQVKNKDNSKGGKEKNQTKEHKKVEKSNVPTKKGIKNIQVKIEIKDPNSKKRKNSSVIDLVSPNPPVTSDKDKSQVNITPRKSLKKEITPALNNKSVVLLFTGVKPTTIEKRKIKNLGVKITDSIYEFTHLIASSANRTFKLLCAINGGKYIVYMQWLLDSIEKGKLLDENKYIIKDPQTEKKYQFRLKESLLRAKKDKVFKNYEFACTPQAKPNPNDLKDIVELGGGKMISPFPSKRIIEEKLKAAKRGDYQFIVLCGEGDDDKFLSDRVGKEFMNGNESIVYKSESVLHASMVQNFELNEKDRVCF